MVQAQEQIEVLIQQIEAVNELDENTQKRLLKQLKVIQHELINDHAMMTLPVKANTKLSKRHKKQLYKLAKQLIKLVKSKQVSDELKFESLAILKEILTCLDEADHRDKQFLSQQTKQVIGISSLFLLLISSLYGIKFNKR